MKGFSSEHFLLSTISLRLYSLKDYYFKFDFVDPYIFLISFKALLNLFINLTKKIRHHYNDL
jgi:hypothetical protein